MNLEEVNTKRLLRELEKMGTHTLDDVVNEVNAGLLQVFVKNSSLLLTQVIDFPRMRVLQFFLAVGTMADMPDLERQATDFAASVGAKRIRAFARPGWARSSIRHGAWKAQNTVWHKDL